MNFNNLTSYPYEHYPKLSIRLCGAAYLDIDKISAAVSELGCRVVWGPYQLLSIVDVAYSLMMVVEDPATNEYYVVIRGTNPESLSSWLEQDFDIDNTQAFNQLAPNAPSSAKVSQGTFNGMNDLLSLPKDGSAPNIVSFLKGASFRNLYVTGHSLGGTLAPPMFAYLNDILYGGGFVHNMALWTFAGLTPGDSGFNTYFNGLFNPSFPWRLHNTLDIAPFMWYSQSSIDNIYSPYGLPIGTIEELAIAGLFELGDGNGYAQPIGDQTLQGDFYLNDKDSYADQAIHQHSHFTYIALVDQYYNSNKTSILQATSNVGVNKDLVILNPQTFGVTVTVQARPTEVVVTKDLPPNGKWVIDPVGPLGTWISFKRTDNDQFLAATLLPEGTTIAQILLDTEIGIVFKLNPEEKLSLSNGLNFPVIVSYELNRTIAISSNRLEPVGKEGSSVVAEQQPCNEDDILWITFKTLDGQLLSHYEAGNSISLVTIEGSEHYIVGTPY